MAAIALIIVVLGSGFWLAYSNYRQEAGQSNDNDLVRSTTCTIDDVDRYNTAMSPRDIPSLTAVAEDIRQRDNYRGDINCLYILIRERLAIGDPDQAEELFSDLQQLSSSSADLSGRFSPPPLGYDAIEATIDSTREENNRDPLPIWEEAE